MTLTSGDTVDARHRGGFLTLTAGGNNNTVGGRGGVVKVTGGFAGGTTDCDLDYYECGGLNITVAMYEAVLHGCTADAGTAASSAFLCGTMEVTTAQRTAVLGGCTQKCLGGAVEVSGGLSSGGVGGAVVVTGGATSSTDPYARGGNVEVRGGTAALGSGGAVLLSSGRSAQRSSGEVLVRTETSGNDGVSGEISVETGASAGRRQRRDHAGHGVGDDRRWRGREPAGGIGRHRERRSCGDKSWREPRRLEEGRRCVHHIWRRHERPGRLWRRARHDGGQR